jgi:hypothetical protein
MTNPNLESTEAEKQRAKEDIEYLPPGFKVVEAKELEQLIQGTFWDYCPSFFIQCIGFGLALISLAVGYGAWKYVIGM